MVTPRERAWRGRHRPGEADRWSIPPTDRDFPIAETGADCPDRNPIARHGIRERYDDYRGSRVSGCMCAREYSPK